MSRRMASMGVVGILCSLLFSTTASAVFIFWDGGGSDDNWSTATNWTNDHEPTAQDDALFRNGGTALISSYGEVCDSLVIADAPQNSGAVEMVGGSPDYRRCLDRDVRGDGYVSSIERRFPFVNFVRQ